MSVVIDLVKNLSVGEKVFWTAFKEEARVKFL